MRQVGFSLHDPKHDIPLGGGTTMHTHWKTRNFVGSFYFSGRESAFDIATFCSSDSNPSALWFSCRPDRPRGPPKLLYKGYPVFPGGKAGEAWCWPPPLATAGLRMGWSWAVPPPCFCFSIRKSVQYDTIFIYCNWVSTRRQWSLHCTQKQVQ